MNVSMTEENIKWGQNHFLHTQILDLIYLRFFFMDYGNRSMSMKYLSADRSSS